MTLAPASPFAAFAALHDPAAPLILVNVWDAGSAKQIADAGAPAIATGSWAVAAAHGIEDGEALPWDLVVANVERITDAVTAPVSVDIERGYAEPADGVGRNVAQIRDAGAVGINIEDSTAEGLRDTAANAERLAAARAAVGKDFWINARTDVFFLPGEIDHSALVDDALARASAYRDAGADSIFVPGLADRALIERFCRESPLPVNVMTFTQEDASRARGLGVARISMGPGPYLAAMQVVAEMTRALLAAPPQE